MKPRHRTPLLGILTLAAASAGCRDDTRDVGPLAGEYGTEVTVKTNDARARVRLETHGAPIEVPLERGADGVGRFRFPFPATGAMELVERGSDVLGLPTFRPALDLGAPAVGDFSDRGLLDVVLLPDGRTAASFAGAVVVARPDGVVSTATFDVGARAPTACPLFSAGGRLGGVFLRGGELVTIDVEGDRATVASTGVRSTAARPLLAAGSDERGAYAWLQTDEETLARLRAPAFEPDGTVAIRSDVSKRLGADHVAAASVSPDGTLWVAWAEDANGLFDEQDALGVTRLEPGATELASPEVFEHVDDTIEHLRVRATNDGLVFFVCGHDEPNAIDRTDRRFCYAGTRGRAGGGGRSAAVVLATADASLRATCSDAGGDLSVVRGGEGVATLYPCDAVSVLSLAPSPTGGVTAVTMANGAIYALSLDRRD